MVTLYIVAVTVLMLASAVWRYRQRDMLGMAASLLVAGLGVLQPLTLALHLRRDLLDPHFVPDLLG